MESIKAMYEDLNQILQDEFNAHRINAVQYQSELTALNQLKLNTLQNKI